MSRKTAIAVTASYYPKPDRNGAPQRIIEIRNRPCSRCGAKKPCVAIKLHLQAGGALAWCRDCINDIFERAQARSVANVAQVDELHMWL